MFASLLTSEQRWVVQQAWLDLETVINTLPPSALTTLLVFHIRNLLDELAGVDGANGTDKVEIDIDIETVHTATSRINLLVQGSPFISDIKNDLTRINQALHTLLYTEELSWQNTQPQWQLQ